MQEGNAWVAGPSNEAWSMTYSDLFSFCRVDASELSQLCTVHYQRYNTHKGRWEHGNRVTEINTKLTTQREASRSMRFNNDYNTAYGSYYVGHKNTLFLKTHAVLYSKMINVQIICYMTGCSAIENLQCKYGNWFFLRCKMTLVNWHGREIRWNENHMSAAV